MTQQKQILFADLPKSILEIGPGVGSNLGYLPDGAEWIGCEPNRHMHSTLMAEADNWRLIRPQILSNKAESLTLPEASVDAVISTLVLCSVTDVRRSIHEIIRVLKPGGRFFFIEHVAARRGTWAARFQSMVHYPWRWLADGCHTNRETADLIQQAGFAELEFKSISVPCPPVPPFLAPHIAGWARK